MVEEIKKYEKKEPEKQEIRQEVKLIPKIEEPKKQEISTTKTLKTFWSRLRHKKPEVINQEIKKEAEKLEAEKQQLLQKSEVSISIDTYDDFFSDFDSRPYARRAISDDFVRESQKMYKESRKGKFELNLLVPTNVRSGETENIVKKRLKEYFKNNSKNILKEIREIKQEAVKLIFLGAFLLAIATSIAFLEKRSLLLLILLTILEPAGWFTMWTGLDKLFYEAKRKKPELEFNTKMANSEINFISY